MKTHATFPLKDGTGWACSLCRVRGDRLAALWHVVTNQPIIKEPKREVRR